MNKAVKDALAKGKVLRAELDQKAETEAKERQEAALAAAAKAKADLEKEAERYLSYVPEGLIKAVAERKPSFAVMTRDSENSAEFSRLCALMEPKLKKMGLQSKHTSSQHYVYLTFDPDTGYDATSYHLEVIVPDEAS